MDQILVQHEHEIRKWIAAQIAQKHPQIARFIDEADIWQEVRLIVHTRQAELRSNTRSSAWSWIMTIARNLLHKKHRDLVAIKRDIRRTDRALHSYGSTSLGELQGLYASLKTPSSQAAQQETKEVLDRAMLCLSSRQRQAVTAFFLHGRDYSQIAKEMDTNNEAVRAYIKHGLKKLRQHRVLRKSIGKSNAALRSPERPPQETAG